MFCYSVEHFYRWGFRMLSVVVVVKALCAHYSKTSPVKLPPQCANPFTVIAKANWDCFLLFPPSV